MVTTPLVLTNTLGGRREQLSLRDASGVRMYSCGPTVYRYVHIGNLRTYLFSDWLRRALELQGYPVTQIMNITDVGHMRQDLVDRGEDKMIAAALQEGRTPAEITEFYTDAFKRDIARLGIQPAAAYPKATEHISAMIALIDRLLRSGHAYEAGGNVYFDVAAFPSYGALSGGAEGLLEGVRAQVDEAKRDPRDFALWKAAEPGRLMQWPSPWGPGFPGWHIECSAMAMQFLGEELDLHTGGVDNIFPHHEDERAQSEAATGRTFVRHWAHGQHLLVDGLKMAKSTGNAYTLDDLIARGFQPAAFRALCLTVHYRQRMNFTFQALRAAHRALQRLRNRVRAVAPDLDGMDRWADHWRGRFWSAVNTDLNLPAAYVVAGGEMLCDATAPEAARVALLLEFDRLLGLDLAAVCSEAVPDEVTRTLTEREQLRRQRQYAAADTMRGRIIAQGYEVRDTRAGPRAVPAPPTPTPPGIMGSAEVPSHLDEPDALELSVAVTAASALDDLRRCVEAALRCCAGERFEVLAVDNGSTDGTRAWLEERAAGEPRLRPFFADHNLGEAAARNVALRQARGRLILWLDTSVELTANPCPALRAALDDARVGAVGPFGLRSADLRTFVDHGGPDVDALEGYLIAFRRERLREIGLLDEKYRFYRNLDLDLSFRLRDRGLRLRTTPDLPLVRHPHRLWESLTEEERLERSRRNFNRFLHHWGRRRDLLLQAATP
jgi:cysteinyl-tRNA synthetase